MLPSEQQAQIHTERSRRMVDEGRFKDAISELKQALAQDTRNASAWLQLGELYAMAGHLEQAASYLQKGVREDYMNMEGWVMLANAYCQIGGIYLELAMEQIDMALGIDANVADLHYLRGNTLAQLGDIKGAKASLQKAIELKPGHLYATRDLQALS